MKFPLIVVNFKAYREASGENSLKLAREAERIHKELNANIVVAPNIVDVASVVKSVEVDVFAQHVDPVPYGAYTGHVSPQYLKDLGVKGTILNHSEKKVDLETLRRTLNVINDLGLESIVCVDSMSEFREVVDLGVKVNCIAIEPPELIGTGRAVSRYKPEVLVRAVEAAEEAGIPLLCGAGIVSGEDVKKAIEAGTKGILVSSGVVKASNPGRVLEEFWKNMI